MQTLCIGSAGKDVFLPTKEGLILKTPEDITSQKKIAFELGAKIYVQDRFVAPGGCAVNVAQGLARLGIEVGCCSMIGDDAIGRWIMEELQKEKVDTSLIKIDEDSKTDLAMIIVNEETGERVIFVSRDANEKLKIETDTIINPVNPEWIFVSSLCGDWEANLDEVLKIVKDQKIKLAFNPGQGNLKKNGQKIIEVIKSANILFVNKDEAIEIIKGLGTNNKEKGINNINDLNSAEFLLKELKKLGLDVVVITDGIKGAWAMKDENILKHDIVKVSSCDTTGAGDAFASGFLAAYLKDKDIKTALEWGIKNGANVVRFYGAKEGLLREEGLN